jgi:hypothetical protein
MENTQEFVGAALATTYGFRLLITLLVKKGIFSEAECVELFDCAQLTMEQQQGQDVPANRQVWEIARSYLDYLAAHPIMDVALVQRSA